MDTVITSAPLVMDPIPHSVCEFGIEARKPQGAWESAFNGPVHQWTNPKTQETFYLATVRLSRMKDRATLELYSTNIVFYLTPEQMQGMHNVYDLGRTTPFTRIRGPRTPVPLCPHREGKLWYDPNPEGVIMEDVREVPVILANGNPGFFVTGQGYRGKVMLPSGKFIHDVGVYGGYLDPQEAPVQMELTHLFGGIEFGVYPTGTMEDEFLTELGDGIWVKGIIGNAVDELHVESYKNSVLLPPHDPERTLIGARSMSETKLLYYFETTAKDRLSGYRMAGFIEGLPHAIGDPLWHHVYRVGLGSNFIESPELDNGFIAFIHVVVEKNNPDYPETRDALYPEIEEQYEGWAVWFAYDSLGNPIIKSCVRAVTPDDIPECYHGRDGLFTIKRVAFPISVFRQDNALKVGYGWGDRSLFLTQFDYETVVGELRKHAK